MSSRGVSRHCLINCYAGEILSCTLPFADLHAPGADMRRNYVALRFTVLLEFVVGAYPPSKGEKRYE
jgi:hypothetical protein